MDVKFCQQLIEMGQNCYNIIPKDTIEEFHDEKAMKMLERSEHMWSLCVASISGVGTSMVPDLTSSSPMEVGNKKSPPFI